MPNNIMVLQFTQNWSNYLSFGLEFSRQFILYKMLSRSVFTEKNLDFNMIYFHLYEYDIGMKIITNIVEHIGTSTGINNTCQVEYFINFNFCGISLGYYRRGDMF